MAPAEAHGLRHQISAPIDRQQQQLQHPDHHADAVQPQNAPGLVHLHRRPVLYMSPTGGSHKCETLTCKTLEEEEEKEHKWLKKEKKGTRSSTYVTAGEWHHCFYSPCRGSHSWRTIPPSGLSARAQVDPRAITADVVDAYHVAVFRVNGVRWAVQMWDPQSGAIHALIKNHSEGFSAAPKRARRPIKEMELTWKSIILCRRWSTFAARKRRRNTFKDCKSIFEIKPKTEHAMPFSALSLPWATGLKVIAPFFPLFFKVKSWIFQCSPQPGGMHHAEWF